MIVLFDLDGTLIDSVPDIHACANAAAADEGLPPVDLPTIRSFVGRGVPHLIERLMAHHGLAPDPAQTARLQEGLLARYAQAVTRTTLYPGVVAALDALAGDHVLGICTNKPETPTRAVLDHLGLTPRFAAIIGGDSAPTRKPDPAPLRMAHAACGTGPALMVGDSEIDAEAARAAGLPFLLYSGGYHHGPLAEIPHDALFDDFSALPGLIAAHAGDS